MALPSVDLDDEWQPQERRPQVETESAPDSRRRSPVLRFLKWYFSCLCPSPHEAHSSSSGGGGAQGSRGRGDASPAKNERNLLMRFLLAENWTDGSLVTLRTDIFAGITLAVAQVAPSVAFALMGHGQPLVGLYSSFFLGIICCVFGGRPGQITAIAGAVVVLYPRLVDRHGYGAACAVSVIAGCFLLLPGIFRFARLVRLLPASLMLGFCNGLGLSMVVNQIPQFKGPDGNYVTGMQAFYTSIICVVTYAVMMLMPYFTTIFPSAFVAIVVGTAVEYIFRLGTVTIGDLYQLQGGFPRPQVPDVNWKESSAVSDIMVASVLTAIVSSVESFMSGYKIQQLTETPTNFEREALALGSAHIVNGFFQGMSGCVVFGPCILNIECGAGTRRLSSFICAIFMFVIPLVLYRVIGIVPMGALSAVLFGVSSKTADWRMLAMIFLQRISFQDSAVAIAVTVVTVVSDLALGAAAGLAAALVFFMWNMSRGRVRLMPMENMRPNHPATRLHRAHPQGPTEQPFAAAAGVSAAPPTEAAGVSVPTEDTAIATVDTIAPQSSENCFSRANMNEEGEGSPTYDLALPDTAPEVLATVLPPQPPVVDPSRNYLSFGSLYELDVNFLDIIRNEAFPEVKVLRIKLYGVLFFGSCMEFVDGMLKMLHEHHSEIFLKVTDFILDFQYGRMPVLDFSAAEAIQDSAHILAKRGIRTHVQNMDPLSWACFDRVRRYFPDVCEDDVNNAKQRCYVRRIFKIMPHCETHDNGAAHHGLDDNVFLRSELAIVRSMTDPSPDLPRGSKGKPESTPKVPQLTANGSGIETLKRQHTVPDPPTAAVPPSVDTEPIDGFGSEDPWADGEEAAHIPPSPHDAPGTDSETALLSSMEVCLPFVDSVNVGFPIYFPELDITVPIFDTVSNWAERTAADIAAGRTPALEVGLTAAKPINRQFGDFGSLWWKRLWNRDIPAWVFENGSPVPDKPIASTPRSSSEPLRRAAPSIIEQIPRFPGQGYAKGERLRRWEWAALRAGVCQKIFGTQPPAEHNRVVEKLLKAEKELVDGFV